MTMSSSSSTASRKALVCMLERCRMSRSHRGNFSMRVSLCSFIHLDCHRTSSASCITKARGKGSTRLKIASALIIYIYYLVCILSEIKYEQDGQSIMTREPASKSSPPTTVFQVSDSPRKMTAKMMVKTMLHLSMGATLLTSPILSA